MLSYTEIIFRLVSAVLIGGVIGLDRNLHGKPTGIKTLGLVAMGASLLSMTGMNFSMVAGNVDTSSVSRVIQGIITGIGFLGAGVITHDLVKDRIHGLTTAASIWVTAALGIVCGVGYWQIAGIAMIIVVLLFTIGRPLEKMLHQKWLAKSTEEQAAITKHEE